MSEAFSRQVLAIIPRLKVWRQVTMLTTVTDE
jgi:hypothetical protein